jgi:hypothetical protein
MKINIFWKYHFDKKIFGKCDFHMKNFRKYENISYFLNFKYLKVWVIVRKLMRSARDKETKDNRG